jgi:hypothetical protein
MRDDGQLKMCIKEGLRRRVVALATYEQVPFFLSPHHLLLAILLSLFCCRRSTWIGTNGDGTSNLLSTFRHVRRIRRSRARWQTLMR